jgi:hypothetical protein
MEVSMKLKTLLGLVLIVLVSLSFCIAGVKGDDKAACCQKGTKASMTKDAKECTMHSAKMSEKCTDAEKASCEMAKGSKASMKKTSGKAMDCCKDKAKSSEAKAGKNEKAAEGKGTN